VFAALQQPATYTRQATPVLLIDHPVPAVNLRMPLREYYVHNCTANAVSHVISSQPEATAVQRGGSTRQSLRTAVYFGSLQH
jgi:hypothetical protein